MARAPRFPLREDVQEHALGRAIGAEAGNFQQRAPSLRPREGIARAADVLEDEVEHDTRHELEGGQVGAGRGLGRRERSKAEVSCGRATNAVAVSAGFG